MKTFTHTHTQPNNRMAITEMRRSRSRLGHIHNTAQHTHKIQIFDIRVRLLLLPKIYMPHRRVQSLYTPFRTPLLLNSNKMKHLHTRTNSPSSPSIPHTIHQLKPRTHTQRTTHIQSLMKENRNTKMYTYVVCVADLKYIRVNFFILIVIRLSRLYCFFLFRIDPFCKALSTLTFISFFPSTHHIWLAPY